MNQNIEKQNAEPSQKRNRMLRRRMVDIKLRRESF